MATLALLTLSMKGTGRIRPSHRIKEFEKKSKENNHLFEIMPYARNDLCYFA